MDDGKTQGAMRHGAQRDAATVLAGYPYPAWHRFCAPFGFWSEYIAAAFGSYGFPVETKLPSAASVRPGVHHLERPYDRIRPDRDVSKEWLIKDEDQGDEQRQSCSQATQRQDSTPLRLHESGESYQQRQQDADHLPINRRQTKIGCAQSVLPAFSKLIGCLHQIGIDCALPPRRRLDSHN